VVFNQINLYNVGFTRSAVNALNLGASNTYRTDKQDYSEVDTPAIYVYSRGTGNVTFAGLVSNERGSLYIEWTEENKPADETGPWNGSLYTRPITLGAGLIVAPVWVHDLVVVNAKDVGTSEDVRFEVYLTVRQGPLNTGNYQLPLSGGYEDAHIVLGATGDAWLQLTLAEITAKTELADNLSNAVLPKTLDMEEIIAKGDLDVLLPNAIRMEYLANSKVASIIIPGVIQFTTKTLDLGDLTLSVTELEQFMIGGQEKDYLVYLLPNGTQL
jgi:hypothetical protein